jgi:hypothetical protein
VQRPFAARRLGAGAVDRRVAIGSFSLAAIGLLCVVTLARAPAPPVRDPAAARDLVALMRLGERGRWIVEYDFTRTNADGRVLRHGGEEGRSGAWHVVIAGTAMTLEHGRGSSACDLLGARYGCKPTPGGRAVPESTVVRVVVAAGAYDVTGRPDARIAGVRARCFRMRATGRGSLPDFGVETDRCLARDGIPLRLVVVRPPGQVEELLATSIRREATPKQVRGLALARGSASGQR